MKKYLALVCLLGAGVFAHAAQTANESSITASNILAADQTPMNGTVCFTPVNAYGQPTDYSMNGVAAIRSIPVCRSVTNGAIVGTLYLPSSNLTIPVGVNYSVKFTDSSTGQQEVFGTYAITGSTWDLDNAAPSSVQTAPPAAWVPVIHIGTVTSLANGSTPTVTDSGSDLSHVFNFGLPQGPAGPPGPAGPQGTGSLGTVVPTATYTWTAPQTNMSFNGTFNVVQPVGTVTLGSYPNFNAGRNASTFTTNAFNGGFNLYSDGASVYGTQLGYLGSNFSLQSYFPSVASASWCTYTQGTIPTNPSGFTLCPFVLGSTSATFGVPLIGTGALTGFTGVKEGSVSSTSNWFNFGATGTTTTTGLNSGYVAYNDGVNLFGETIGYLNSSFNSIRIAPSTDGFSDCFYTSGALPANNATLVSNCPLQLTNTKLTLSGLIVGNGTQYITGFTGATTGSAATTANWFSFNPRNIFSNTALNYGTVLYDDGANIYGDTIGYFGSGFWKVQLAPAADGFADCFFAPGAVPTSNATLISNCPFEVSGTTGVKNTLPTELAGDLTVDANTNLNVQGSIGTVHGGTGFLNYPGVDNFGDSITVGVGSDNTGNATHGYAYIMDPEFQGITHNYARIGDQACDTTRLDVFQNVNPTVIDNPTITYMLGTNDAQYEQASATYPYVFNECMMAGLVHLATPSTSRISGQSGSVTATGTWAADNTVGTGYGIQSSIVGNTLSFSVHTTGGPIYLLYRIIDGNTSSATVTIDGTAAGTIYGSGGVTGGVSIATQNATTDSIAASRFPVAWGTHAVVITLNGTAGQPFTFMEAATPSKPLSPGPPRVLVGGVIEQQYNAEATYTLAYDGYVRALTTELWSDGLYTEYVNTRPYLNPATDYYNNYHPNDIGHQHLANAYENAAGNFGSMAKLKAQVTTTAATSDTVAIPEVPVGSFCIVTPGNVSAATNITTTYAPQIVTAGSVVLDHSAVAGMIYGLICTP
jgi:hypothetical protein